MPVEPWIPLAGRPLQLPSIGEQLTLRDYAQQMQIRNQVQALQSQPGMFEGGLATDKYLIALNQIDRSLGQAETMKRAQQLNYMSLERQRAAAEKEKIEGMRQDALDDVWSVGLKRAYASGNPDDMYKYVDEQLEEWDKSGKAKDLRMTPEMIQAARQRRGMDDIQTILIAHGKEKTVEDIRYQHDIEEQKNANRKVMEYTGKPVEGISTEGLPLSDVGKPLEARGLTQEPAIEQQALEPEKQHVEPPEPTESKTEQPKPKPEDTVYGEREVTADRPPVTVEDFYSRAEKLEKLADKAQSSRRKKELLEQANHDRQRAEGLDRSINAERRTDIMEDRLKLAVDRVAATQQPLDPRTAALLGEAVAKGNYALAAGLARNQVAQRQVKEAVGEYARRNGWSAADLNAAHMKFSGSMKAQAGFMAGPEARNVTAINTAIGHMGTMSNLAEALSSTDSQAINAAVNAVANQFGDPSITNYEVAKSAVANELMRVFRQVGASETEVQEWERKFKNSQTPDQIRGALNVGADLLDSRIKNLRRQAERAGIEVPDIVSPESEQALNKIRSKARQSGSGEARGTFQRAEPIKPYDDAEKEKRYQEYKRKHGY